MVAFFHDSIRRLVSSLESDSGLELDLDTHLEGSPPPLEAVKLLQCFFLTLPPP